MDLPEKLVILLSDPVRQTAIADAAEKAVSKLMSLPPDLKDHF
jgi:hypothetical protein